MKLLSGKNLSFRHRNSLLKFLLVNVLLTTVLFFSTSCNNTTSSSPEKDLLIVNPKGGNNNYSYVNPIDIIYRYNPATVRTPAQFEFSKDNKKTWIRLKPDFVHTSLRNDGNFTYKAFKWTPEKDSLTVVDIYIKAKGYNAGPGEPEDLIGPIHITE